MEVAGYNLLADMERSTIYLKVVRKVVHHRAYLELACGNEELTAGLHTLSVTGNYNRNVNYDRLGVVYGEEIYMEALVLYRMPLKLVKNGIDFLSVAEFEVDDV